MPRPPNPCDQCGSNTQCLNNACSCMPDFQGDPYVGCRPECVLNTDCSRAQACIRSKCRDPCPGICGQNAVCSVVNHVPVCTCATGMAGNAFLSCSPLPGTFFKTSPNFRLLISLREINESN